MSISIQDLRAVLNYDPEIGEFTWKVMLSSRGLIGTRAGTKNNWGRTSGYFKIRINKKDYWRHRLAWFYMTGEWPQDQIDHINGIKGDDRFCNLREATHSENQQNCILPRHNTSGHKGVSWRKSNEKWYAYIKKNGKMVSLGLFDNIDDAIRARATAAPKYHGAFARTA